jgi:hypothetical protein
LPPDIPEAEVEPTTGRADAAASGHRRGGTILTALVGGLVAGAAGFALAFYLATAQPALLGIGPSAEAEQQVSALRSEVGTLSSDLAATSARLADIEALRASIEALKDATGNAGKGATEKLASALDARLKAIENRIARLEAAPVAAAGADLAAVEAQRRAAEDAAAEAEKLRTEAEARNADTRARSALAELRAAFDSGAALDGALDRLAAAGVGVPEALAEQAQGVPTLDALRDGFPAAAREALAVALGETAGDTIWGRMTAFMRSQTGARSLSPRAGDDPDAILSRAEAALGTGDLKAALSEIAALPDGGRARMSEWAGLAERRLAAADALDQLSDVME